MNKFLMISNAFGFAAAVFLAFALHSSGNGEASFAWVVVALMGFGNLCGSLGDLLEERKVA